MWTETNNYRKIDRACSELIQLKKLSFHSGSFEAAGALRVDDGQGLRQPGGGALVVVGYDEVEADIPRVLRLAGGRYAAVDGYEQRRALSGERVHRGRVEAVALLEPVGYVGEAPQPARAQPARHEAGGGYPVHVVVPVYGHRLPALDGEAQPGGGLVHVQHLFRRAERVRPRGQEGLRLRPAAYPAPREHGREHGRIPRRKQLRRQLLLPARNNPFAILHLST